MDLLTADLRSTTDTAKGGRRPTKNDDLPVSEGSSRRALQCRPLDAGMGYRFLPLAENGFSR